MIDLTRTIEWLTEKMRGDYTHARALQGWLHGDPESDMNGATDMLAQVLLRQADRVSAAVKVLTAAQEFIHGSEHDSSVAGSETILADRIHEAMTGEER